MPLAFGTPGVYEDTPPRHPPPPLPRTDIAGFVGFERRIRDSSVPTRLSGSPAVGHRFAIDVLPLRPKIGGRESIVPPHLDLVLSAADDAIPMPPGGSIAWAVVAARIDDTVRVVPLRGPVASDARALVPDDAAISKTLPAGAAWVRIGGVHIRRAPAGDRVHLLVLPGPTPIRCDDWSDFEGALGPVDSGDTMMLGRAVRGFFTAGGRRCHIALVARPQPGDPEGLGRVARELLGTPGQRVREATGLERLLLVDEVSIVDAPDLYARRVDPDRTTRVLPPVDTAACFRRCAPTAAQLTAAAGQHVAHGPLFDEAATLEIQRAMLLRCAQPHWRVVLLLTAPVEIDAATGRYDAPSLERALRWRERLDGVVDDLSMSCAAVYFPWVLVQDDLGADTIVLPPVAFAAGILAKRDLARGPHVAPAGESVRGIVGLATSIDDPANAKLYSTPHHINALRVRPGRGITVWGARTMSRDPWLRYLSVRRCLSAIQRKVAAAFESLTFEPNSPTLWLQMTQTVLSVLLPVFEAGALRGATPAEAFFIRCDESNNPPDQRELGRVVCEVGVAIAAPAEYVVFRLAKLDSAVEIHEVT